MLTSDDGTEEPNVGVGIKDEEAQLFLMLVVFSELGRMSYPSLSYASEESDGITMAWRLPSICQSSLYTLR